MATNEIYTGQVSWRGASYEVQFAHYPNGRTAIVLLGIDDPTDNARATVNVPELPMDLDQVLVKDIDENAGMVAALVAAGVVTDLGRDVSVNRYHLRLCRLQRLEVNVPDLLVQWDGVTTRSRSCASWTGGRPWCCGTRSRAGRTCGRPFTSRACRCSRGR